MIRLAWFLERLVNEVKAPIVTLTGPEGIGKTRLSLQVAANLIDSFEDLRRSLHLSDDVDIERTTVYANSTLSTIRSLGPHSCVPLPRLSLVRRPIELDPIKAVDHVRYVNFLRTGKTVFTQHTPAAKSFGQLIV
jgi:hypothetical protein